MKTNEINRLLGVSENYQAPERLMKVLMDKSKRTELLENFLKGGVDLSSDFFVNYFEEEHADRKVKKQDFTPLSVSNLMANIVTGGKNYYESAVGTGSIMIQYWKDNQDSYFELEELSDRAVPFLLLNMLLRNISGVVRHGDSLSNDFKKTYRIENGELSVIDTAECLEVDSIAMNPPYSASWSGDKKLIEDKRFDKYGVAPKSKADFAFLLNAFYKLADSGTMAIILPHGVLFRGGAEGKIRESLLKSGEIEAVIGLPSKLFSATQIPTVVLVLKKQRTDKNVLFIDASREFDKGKNQNFLNQGHLEKVLRTYRQKLEIEKYSHLAEFEELESNDFNLNIPRYIDTFEEEEPIDIVELSKEILAIDAQIKDTEAQLLEMLDDLTGDVVAIEATKSIFR